MPQGSAFRSVHFNVWTWGGHMPRGHQHQGPCHPHKKVLESVLRGGKGKAMGAVGAELG